MKKKFSKPMNQLEKDFKELYKKWAADNKFETSCICSVAIHERLPLPKNVGLIPSNDQMTMSDIHTLEIELCGEVPFKSHARTLRKNLEESYGDESDEE